MTNTNDKNPSSRERERIQDEIDRLIPKAESGEQWAHICKLEAELLAA